MKNSRFFCWLIILVLIASTIGCGARSDETTPEMAKSMLNLSGFKFTEEDFFRAVRMENAPIVRAFLQAGMNPNTKNEDGETALTFALQKGDEKTISVLVEKADLNMKDDKGNAPLHLAITKDGLEPVFDSMLEKGADVNVGGKINKTENQTPLYAAVVKQREDLVQKLLEKGADPNKADSEGALPLSESVLGAADPTITKMLLEKGANVNAQESNGATALIYLATNKKITPEKRAELVRLLLDKGADKTIKDKKGKTAAVWAKELDNTDVVELLK
jgi:ankyrin repeat protein